MTSQLVQALTLIATLSVFCAAFCPALIWVLTTPLPKQA